MLRAVFQSFVYMLLWVALSMGAYGLTVPASEDTIGYLNKLTAASNASPILQVDASHKSFLYFNLDDVPQDAVLRWAKLRLFLPTVRLKGAGLGVHVVTSQWNEALASNQPTVATGTVASIGPENLGTRRFVTVDVTRAVQSWISRETVNEGFAIAPIIRAGTVATSLYLTSKDGAGYGLPAELDLEFKPEAEAPSQIKIEQLPPAITSFLSPVVTSAPTLSLSTGTIEASVAGLGTLSSQWYKNGVAIPGQTSPILRMENLSEGTYTLRVSNGFTTVTSSSVRFDPSVYSSSLKLIAAGTFKMIGPDSERMVHVKDFYIGENDVQYREWKTVRAWAEAHGYAFENSGAGFGENHPVQSVSWFDAVKWCNAKSEMEGLTPVYFVAPTQREAEIYRSGELLLDDEMVKWNANGYRLPTETEWEKAARGGLEGSLYPNGNFIDSRSANFGSTVGKTSPVGSYPANGYGLYDMAGNVWQWCWDRNDATWASEIGRGARGGSFSDDISQCGIAKSNLLWMINTKTSSQVTSTNVSAGSSSLSAGGTVTTARLNYSSVTINSDNLVCEPDGSTTTITTSVIEETGKPTVTLVKRLNVSVVNEPDGSLTTTTTSVIDETGRPTIVRVERTNNSVVPEADGSVTTTLTTLKSETGQPTVITTQRNHDCVVDNADGSKTTTRSLSKSQTGTSTGPDPVTAFDGLGFRVVRSTIR